MPILARLFSKIVTNNKKMRSSQFDELPPQPGAVVFLGDSITEQGLWNEWFPGIPVINRGIGGDTTGEVLDRVSAAINQPKAVFLLIGTNDLYNGIPRSKIVANVEAIIKYIRQEAPNAQLHVQSVMPRTKKYRDRIVELNRDYERIAQENNAVFIDLWPALGTTEGELKREFSLDKVHLTGAGYRAWMLMPELQAMRLTMLPDIQH